MNHSASIAFFGKDFASLQLFQGVAFEVLRELMASMHSAQYQKGAVFLPQGALVSRHYIVLEGWCAASKGNTEGQESLLQLFRRGDFLLDAASPPDEISAVNLQALTPVRLLTISPGALRLAMERSPTLTANMLAASARACRDMRDHIEQLTLHTAEQRVGRFLLQMLFHAGSEGRDIVLPFDKAFIASYLNIKPETFSRVLHLFRKRGFVVDRGHLMLPVREALCAYCDKSLKQCCPFSASGSCTGAAEDGVKPP